MKMPFLLNYIVTSLILISSTLAQENASLINNITEAVETTTEYVLPIDLSSIFQIKFVLKEEGLSQVAAQLIYNATSFNITVNDLVDLTQAEQLNLTTINEALDKLDLSSTDLFNFDSLESSFNELNISLLELYGKLRKEFIPVPRDNVPRLLDTFNISQNGFNDIILYGNDTKLFELLKSGNFSEENVKVAFELIGKTPSDLYDFLKPDIFPRIREYSIERLLDIIKSNGLAPKHMKDVLEIFNLRRAGYEAVPSFRSALSDLEDEMNNVELYGTLVNSSVVATVNNVYNKYKYFQNIADAYVENVFTPRVSFKVDNIDAYDDNCLYGPVLVTFEASSVEKIIGITQEYSEHHPRNCFYAINSNGSLIIEKLYHVHYSQNYLIADVSNSTIFKIGSPLICNDLLYGVAESESKGKIGFRSFYCSDDVPDTTTIFADETSSASIFVVEFQIIIFMFVVKYLIDSQ